MPISSNSRLSIAVLIVSCDNYADLWPPFFQLFRRFWPDCPFPVYLLTNERRTDTSGVVNLPIGRDVSWSDNVKEGLKCIPEEYVLMHIDDLFLLKTVDTSRLIAICQEFIEIGGNYLRLNPTIAPDKGYNDHFGRVSPGSIYRTSTVLSVWKKEVLDNLLLSGENAWEFEILGSVRSDVYDDFYATWENCFRVVNGVIKGKWRQGAWRTVCKLCPTADLGPRGKMTIAEEVLFFLKLARSRALNFLPARCRRRIKYVVLSRQYNYRLNEKSRSKS